MTASPYTLSTEQAADWWEVEALFDLCFAPGRTALSSYRLREDVEPVAELCLVARDAEGVLSGAIRHWPVRIGDAASLLLGPVAVHPTRQGEGVAAMLVGQCIDRARETGWQRILLVGDAPYYRRYGFERLDHVRMPPPTNPERVLGLSLTLNAWDGITGKVTRSD